MREIFGDAAAVPRGTAPDQHGERFRSPREFSPTELSQGAWPRVLSTGDVPHADFLFLVLRHAPGIFVTAHPQARQSRAI